MDLKNQIELELYFADHFDTILFPVLADIYLNQEDYRRARKVCNIGLGYHENDATGRFVLAKVENKKNKTSPKKVSKRSTPKKVIKKVDENTDSLNVSVRLATFTLVNVLKNQALFYQALEVLDLLEQKGEDPDMIRLERDSVKALIKTSEKENEKS